MDICPDAITRACRLSDTCGGPTLVHMTGNGGAHPRTDARRRVLIVDADHRVRDSLADLIELTDGLVVVGATGAPAEALELAGAHEPDIVLLDPRLPELDVALSLMTAIRASHPDVRVFIMGWSDAMENFALACDADGFIDKQVDPAGLLEAVADGSETLRPRAERALPGQRHGAGSRP